MSEMETYGPAAVEAIPARDVRVGDVLVTPSHVYRVEKVEWYGVRAEQHNTDWPIVGLYGGSQNPWGGDGVRVFRGPDELVQVVRAEDVPQW